MRRASPDRLEVAAAAYSLDPVASLEEWRRKTARWVADGARTGAQLIVFPEYGAIEIAHAAGPESAGDLRATLDAVAGSAGAMDEAFLELARAHGVHVLCPSGPRRRHDGRFVNAAALVTPHGRLGLQEKLIMTPFEADWGIEPGTSLHVFDTRLGRIGVALCYDCEFPLIVRAMAEAGAETVLVPSCTERVSGYHRVRTAAMARALESTIATVQSSTIGDAPWSPAVDRNAGAAGIYVPAEHLVSATGVLAEGRLGEPGWTAAAIDLSRLRQLRSQGEMRNDADWRRQPGAGELAFDCAVVDLS